MFQFLPLILSATVLLIVVFLPVLLAWADNREARKWAAYYAEPETTKETR